MRFAFLRGSSVTAELAFNYATVFRVPKSRTAEFETAKLCATLLPEFVLPCFGIRGKNDDYGRTYRGPGQEDTRQAIKGCMLPKTNH